MPEEEQMQAVAEMPAKDHFGGNIHPGNKKILWLIVFLLLIVIGGIAGLYLINQEEALNNELISVHLNDGPKARKVVGNGDELKEDGEDEESDAVDNSSWVRYQRNNFSFEYPQGWQVYGQSFLLSDYQFAEFLPELLFNIHNSVVFPEEVGEGGVPWKFNLSLLKQSELSLEEILDAMRAHYVEPEESVYEANGLTIYEFVGAEAGVVYTLEKSAEYLIVADGQMARLGFDSYSEYAESDFEIAKMIAESIQFES